ncbi:hypothetical protein DACRYDRAFT_24856 [Dacryopinax primogenitus]|uniref:Uncharacterized protein n=1 Tax=Dacryopinax primogenitus (strain DJM 731) TaxID=1858805 RepID=M5FS36_DACPD|nr:uncharacterized protein DACRYDRAFT_24856 [Dacryopinax primogenitus]EJT97939.1 hypothetical protein DACRYDRAFT_24856 [Dacryopinax primogenitus]
MSPVGEASDGSHAGELPTKEVATKELLFGEMLTEEPNWYLQQTSKRLFRNIQLPTCVSRRRAILPQNASRAKTLMLGSHRRRHLMEKRLCRHARRRRN